MLSLNTFAVNLACVRLALRRLPRFFGQIKYKKEYHPEENRHIGKIQDTCPYIPYAEI
jgi:hypothetical protein